MRTPTLQIAVSVTLVATALGCDRDTTAPDTTAHQASSPTEIPDDQSQSGTSSAELYHIDVTPQPNPIPFQQLFELRIDVHRGDTPEKPDESAKIDDVRAVMPAHDHGMKTEPEVSKLGPGRFRVEGMRFHMQGADEDGRWVLKLLLDGSEGKDRASFDFQCCKPR